jgi:hypothetical protein
MVDLVRWANALSLAREFAGSAQAIRNCWRNQSEMQGGARMD